MVMNIKCRVNFVEETAFRLMVMKKQVFRECRVNYNEIAYVKIDGDEESSAQGVQQVFIRCRVNFIEETGMVMEKQAFRLMVMKKQVFRECRINYNEITGVKIDGNEESSVQKV